METNDYMTDPSKRAEIEEEIYTIFLRESLLRRQAIEVLESVAKRVEFKSVVSE